MWTYMIKLSIYNIYGIDIIENWIMFYFYATQKQTNFNHTYSV